MCIADFSIFLISPSSSLSLCCEFIFAMNRFSTIEAVKFVFVFDLKNFAKRYRRKGETLVRKFTLKTHARFYTNRAKKEKERGHRKIDHAASTK